MTCNQKNPGITALVLGGKGFIGRHVVANLQANGVNVLIGTRHPHKAGPASDVFIRPVTQRETRFEQLTAKEQWLPLLKSVDVVINAVGILRQRPRETYTDIHHLAPVALAQACKEKGIRFVHVSALGLEHNARSRFLRSKREGDLGVQGTGGDWYVVRPSLVDGDKGYGAKWIRTVANWPIHFLPGRFKSRIAAVDSQDLGAAIATIATYQPTQIDRNIDFKNRIFEVGGNNYYQMREYLSAMRETCRPALSVTLPGALSRLISHLCDLFHVTPFSFGHFELLQKDNVPAPNRLAELLGRAPSVVGRAPRPASGHKAQEPGVNRITKWDLGL